jgi:nucleotide-binding universal stress UspA family protein
METCARTALFDRVVCGVDRSPAGIAAARGAARIVTPEGSLALVSVNDPSIAIQAGWRMPQVLDELAIEAQAALKQAVAEAEPQHAVEAKLVEGDPLQALLLELARRDGTLVVVGSHGISRATGIALGAVSTHLLHEAPCAVLIARGTIDVDHWPRGIVVGIDGSESSANGLEAARSLGERFGAPVRALTALRDSHVDLAAAHWIAPELEEHDAGALDALRSAAEGADLVVVGSRGLRGIRALGSVSERLAHQAGCSVLVVRTQPDHEG